MEKGVVGYRGPWFLALCGALGFAAACGGDDDDKATPPAAKAGAAGKGAAGGAGKPAAGSAGTAAGTAGTAAGSAGTAGTTGGSAGSTNAGGTSSGGVAGSTTAGSGGTAGSVAGAGGSAGTTPIAGTGGIGGEGGLGGEAGGGGQVSTGGTAGIGGRGGNGGANPGGAAGNAGEGGVGADAGAGGAGDSAPNLYFSEYVENNLGQARAVEIINKSGSAVNLSTCEVLLYANAAASSTTTVALTGTVANNDVFVLCSAAITTLCDQVAATLVFDGNDAVALRCGTTRVDIIGRTTGVSPGTQWGDTTVGTRNQTLRRKCTTTTGDRDGSNDFTPSAEWTSLPLGTTSGLGSATCS